ncbi:MAG: hypothetical protein VKK07_11035 [Merismopediaceae bacterium]|nr:hypothetical protein [Merismopediaceae bacterium]
MLESQNPAFLTPSESAAVDAALLSQPEKFLTRLTISSLRLLQLISESTATPITELTPEQIIAWFEKDAKIKRELGVEASQLHWE